MKIRIEWPIYRAFPDGSETETVYVIECGLTKGDPGCHTMKNGDPGWPPSDPECEIEMVMLNGGVVDNWEEFIDADMQDAIATAAFQKASDDEEGAAEDHADAERERRLERD